MNIKKCAFLEKDIVDFENSKKIIKDRYNLNPINNTYLLQLKLKEYKDSEGVFLECGTFEGNTLLTAAQFCEDKKIETKLIGIDTFNGFPVKKLSRKNNPSYFKKLYNKGRITAEHYEKVKKYIKDFKKRDHLSSSYFSNINNIFEKVKDFRNIQLISGTFEEVLPSISTPISILHIDVDLYESYLVCLKNLYKNVINGGCIIFDEYYSLKYPGARVAVDEFFKNKKGVFEVYTTSEGFERWCYIKNE